MEITLVDDDSLYCTLFEDYFISELNIIPKFVQRIRDFPLKEASTIDFLIVDHSLLDGSGVDFIERIRPYTEAQICIISTYGNVLKPIERALLSISADLKKTDVKSILCWYSYFKPQNKKKLQKDPPNT